MDKLIYAILGISGLTLFLSLITKYAHGVPRTSGMVAGVGPSGYLTATIVLLLVCANLALLQLLKKTK